MTLRNLENKSAVKFRKESFRDRGRNKNNSCEKDKQQIRATSFFRISSHAE
jgi:hypothetical protein